MHRCHRKAHNTCQHTPHTMHTQEEFTKIQCTAAKHMLCAHTTHNVTDTCHIEHYIYIQTRQAHAICTCTLTKIQTLHSIYYITCIHRKPHICFPLRIYMYIMQNTHIQIICTCYMHTHLYHAIWAHVMSTKHSISLHTHNLCPHTSPAHTPCATHKPYVDLRQKCDPQPEIAITQSATRGHCATCPEIGICLHLSSNDQTIDSSFKSIAPNIFIIMLRLHLPYKSTYFSFSPEYAMEFSRESARCVHSIAWTLKQMWEPSCHPLSQESFRELEMLPSGSSD